VNAVATKRANKVRFSLPMSRADIAYLVNLIGIDIARLKGSKESALLAPAYRLHDKLRKLQGGAA